MADPFLGEIRMFAGSYAPRGWAFCQGQILAIAQNSALFSLLGTTYGGNGTTTFALPDFRGRVPTGIGAGPGLQPVVQGEIAGTPTVTLNTNQLPIHTPTATFQGTPATGTASIPVGVENSNPIQNPTAGATSYLTAASAAVGRDAANINGLYTNTVPATPGNIGGGTATVTASGTVTIAPIGGSQPIPIAQPYIGMNFIIALEGIYPSRN